MRFLALLLALTLIAPPGQAQSFRIAGTGCKSPGEVVTITGRGFTRTRTGEILLMSRSPQRMRVQSWSARQVRAALPRRGVKAGETYGLRWQVAGAQAQSLGRVTICKAAGSRTTGRNPQRAPRDVVPAPDGSPEYVVIVSSGQAQAAINAMQQQGASLQRNRALPQLGRRVLTFAFPAGLSLPRARTVLRSAAPSARIDLHHVYGFAADPRLYAAAMIGDDPGSPCRLGRAVRVGIIDGPVNPAHPALRGVGVQRRSVLTGGERAASAAHGTAVASLIAGNPSAGALAGFAGGARIYAAEAFSSTRGRTGARIENVAAGIDWLLSARVRLVNLSMSGPRNEVMAELIRLAGARGMVMVAAVGNEGSSAPRYPSALSQVIAVTAVDASGRLYGKANRGAHVEFAAPGVQVYTAKGGAGGYQTGTSFAAPIVTALLARQAARSGLSADSARRLLKRGIRDLGPGGRDTSFGFGLVRSGGC